MKEKYRAHHFSQIIVLEKSNNVTFKFFPISSINLKNTIKFNFLNFLPQFIPQEFIVFYFFFKHNKNMT